MQLNGLGSSRTELLSFSIAGVDDDLATSHATGSTLKPSSGEFFEARIGDFVSTYGFTGAQFAGSIPTVVPVPAALWLLGSGLIALFGFARKQKSL